MKIVQYATEEEMKKAPKFFPKDTTLYVEETKKMYNHKGEPIESKSGLNLSLYELNQSIMSQMPEMKDFSKAENLFIELDTLMGNEFYMLYGKTVSYFTMFRVGDIASNRVGCQIIDFLCENFAKIYSIDYNETKDAIEIWASLNKTDTPEMFLFFAYDSGIVEVY